MGVDDDIRPLLERARAMNAEAAAEIVELRRRHFGADEGAEEAGG